ncbi:MAG: ATP-grasp fold amidoligase family protein [Candidatus Saccharicenans sp.]|jgi:hypothetical protein|nr:glycosyl transferase [Candidatus Saccharicenans sp.]MDH7575623.1 ATP-grasp fold amidoligase family protein [Candidatus Saccharicenans sp.]
MNKLLIDIFLNKRIRKLLYLISPKILISYRYLLLRGRLPILNNPKLLDEKLIWLNLYWKHPLKTICADKYLVRNYIKKQHLENILVPLLGNYSSPDEIDFDKLPSKFVLKCNHGCGFNIFCTDKRFFNFQKAKTTLSKWQRINFSHLYGELHYSSIKPMILCEEFLDDKTGALPIDYKLYCFDGLVHCTMVCIGRDINSRAKQYIFFDRDWKKRYPYNTQSIQNNADFLMPEAYLKLVEYAEILSKPFPFVRIDFYIVDNKPFFGEMTFTPDGCIDPNLTQEAQMIMGDLINLPKKYL